MTALGGTYGRLPAGNAQNPRDYIDLHVFKSIKAILRQPDQLIGPALASTARTASASQYGL